MALECPWCQKTLDRKFVGDLTKVPQPCPSCGKPVRQSIRQVLFTALLLLPVVAVFLYLAYALGESGHTLGAIGILFCGGVVAILVQAHFPTRHGPAKGV